MYRRLRLPPQASEQQIRRAYRQLAHDVHPDTNPEDPQAARRFQQITEAYDILSHPDRRARYDQVHLRPSQPHRTEPPGPSPLTAEAFPTTSPPLIAGPVHITPSRHPHPTPKSYGDLNPDQLTQVFRLLWRSQ